jgi:predicted RNase H-like HicB family nuclease
MRYAVVIEKAGNNYGAYVPDLPGCIATGDTVEEVEANIRDAIEMHIEGMLEDGLPIPPSMAHARYVEVEPKVLNALSP